MVGPNQQHPRRRYLRRLPQLGRDVVATRKKSWRLDGQGPSAQLARCLQREGSSFRPNRSRAEPPEPSSRARAVSWELRVGQSDAMTGYIVFGVGARPPLHALAEAVV